MTLSNTERDNCVCENTFAFGFVGLDKSIVMLLTTIVCFCGAMRCLRFDSLAFLECLRDIRFLVCVCFAVLVARFSLNGRSRRTCDGGDLIQLEGLVDHAADGA